MISSTHANSFFGQKTAEISWNSSCGLFWLLLALNLISHLQNLYKLRTTFKIKLHTKSGPPRKFAGPGAKLYLGSLWRNYFQTTKLKTGGQRHKALRIFLNGALNALYSPQFWWSLAQFLAISQIRGPLRLGRPGASCPPAPPLPLSAALCKVVQDSYQFHGCLLLFYSSILPLNFIS